MTVALDASACFQPTRHWDALCLGFLLCNHGKQASEEAPVKCGAWRLAFRKDTRSDTQDGLRKHSPIYLQWEIRS